DLTTHAVPGFPTTNFTNTGLTQFGQINTFRSTMYWGSTASNSTGAADRDTWTITYTFSQPVPVGVRIVLFDIGVSTTPQPPVNRFTLTPRVSGGSVSTAGWTSVAYAPNQVSGNTEHATFNHGTTTASFSNIGTPTGNYIIITANTSFNQLTIVSTSARFNAF